MTYYYARVSSKEQNLGRQIKAFTDLGAAENEIVLDKESGKDFNRVGYSSLKSKLRDGDVLYIHSLDRLSRNKEDIKSELQWFKENKIRLKVLDLPTTMIDVPEGNEWIIEMVNNILIEVLSSIAEQERNRIKERQKQGIDAMPIVNGKRVSARTGKGFGRQGLNIPKEEFQKLREKQKDGHLTVNECCEILDISRSKWYGLCREAL